MFIKILELRKEELSEEPRISNLYDEELRIL